MEHILAVGNYMNGKSKRGGAWGFKFESMIKACETRTSDNKRNLLQVVLDIMENFGEKVVFDEKEKFADLAMVKKFPVN